MDPVQQIRIPQEFFSRPANAGTCRRRVVTPDPVACVDCSFSLQQPCEFSSRRRTVPPWAGGNSQITEHGTLAVHIKPVCPVIQEPCSDRFVRRVTAIAIVIARTDHQSRAPSNPVQIFFDYDYLDIEVEGRTEVEEVAANNDNII